MRNLKVMKQNKEIPTFKEYMDASIEESIDESYANYGGTNALGSVQSSSKNKYTPATVLKAPPLRFKNADISMGQSEIETQAPSPMIYPFESIFSELVELFTRAEALARTMDGASDMATLSDAKKESVKLAVEELDRVQERLYNAIKKIEEVTI